MCDSSSFSGTQFHAPHTQGWSGVSGRILLSGQPRLSSFVYFSCASDCHIPTRQTTSSQLLLCLKEVPQDSCPIVGPNTFVDVVVIDTTKGSKKFSIVKEEVDDILLTKQKSTV